MLNIEMSVGEETDDSNDVSWVNNANGPNESADKDDDESINEEGDEVEEGDESVGEEGDESVDKEDDEIVDKEDDEIELVDLEDEPEKPSIKKTPKPSKQCARVAAKETATKQLVCKPLSGSRHLTSVFPALSQCARFLYVASGNEVFVYSTQSGEKTFTFTKHEVNVVGVQGFAGKKDLVWSCDQNGQSYLWNHNTGTIIKKHWFGKTREVRVFNFYAPHEENIAYVLVHFWEKERKKRFFLRVNMAKGVHRKVFVEIRLQTGQGRIAFGCGRESPVVAAANEDTVMVENVHTLEKNHFCTSARKFTCVALHPDDSLMAVGDISGRILIFRDLFKLNAPVSSIYHWHTLPVRCLAFSDEGSFLLSGGEENTLVKWNMESGVKNFLPRMGAPLHSIACAPGNEIFVTAHSNNTVRVISPLLRIVQSISGMVKHEKIPNLDGKDALVPTGLVFDPRSRAVILNGLTGHLQFYDVEQDKLLYNLDITHSNIVTRERHQQLVNKEVVKVAISSSGTWLATVERWPSPMGSVDLQLKFWHFDITKQTFVLNTQVAMPHEEEVHSIAFQPGECNAQFPLLVTTGGQDGQFKIWRPVDETDIYGSKVGWNCDVVGEFRHLPAEKVSFSEDGSLFVVAFHEILTVWEADTAQLKTTLSHNCITSSLSWVEFGRKECCHMLMCGFKTTLLAWDLLCLSLKWKVNLRSPMVSLAVDPESDYMAVITVSDEIFTFQPSSATLAFHEKKLHGQRALAATFIPRMKTINSGISWLQASELVLIDKQQNLVLVEQSSDSKTKPSNRVNLPDNLPFTPFAALRAQTRTSDIKGLEPTVHTSRGIAGFDTVQSLLENPGSTLPPVNRLCGHFLESLLSRLDIKKDNKPLLTETEFPDSREEERRIPIHLVNETPDNFKWLRKQ